MSKNKSELRGLQSAYSRVNEADESSNPAITAAAQQIAGKVEAGLKSKSKAPVGPANPEKKKIGYFDVKNPGSWSAVETPPGDEGFNIGTWNGYKTLVIDLVRAYHADPKENLLVYGDAGIGKSATVLQVCRRMAEEEGKEFANWGKSSSEKKMDMMNHPEKYFALVDIRTAGLEPSDIVGIPNINSAKDYLEVKQGPWIYFISRPEASGFIFFDEINQGSEQVLKAFFEVVYDKSAAGTPISDRMSIVAAGNLGGIYNNADLPPALTDRFTAGFLIVDSHAWLRWAEGSDDGDDDVDSLVASTSRLATVAKNPGLKAPRLDPLILGFVKSNPTENFNFKPVHGQPSNKLPTPRSMTALTRSLHKIYQDYYHVENTEDFAHFNAEPMMQAMARKAAHICGPHWGNAFMAFVEHMWKLTLEKVLGHAERGELGAKSKAYVGAGMTHAIMRWLTEKIRVTVESIKAGNPANAEDEKILTAVAIISNHLAKTAPEWLATLWSTFKYEMPDEWAVILEYLESGKYDDKIKKEFKTTTLNKLKLSITDISNITYDSNGQPQLKPKK
jgi:hypothetical protein